MVFISDGKADIGARVRSKSLLFDVLKAFDKIKNIQQSDMFRSEKSYFPSCVRNMFWVTF